MSSSFDRLELVSEHGSFGGVQRFYKHASTEIGLPMRFALFLPPPAQAGQAVPLLTFLAGLTCTEETATMKAGAQRLASQLGLALLMPDTSPRNTGVDSEDHHWDFGVGAGFYLDATQSPWAGHWCMESYLLKELLPAVCTEFKLHSDRLGITGPGPAPSGPVPQRFGLRPDLRPHPMPLGTQGLHRLPGSRRKHLGGPRRQPAHGRPADRAVPRRHPGGPGPGRQIPRRTAPP